MLISSEKNFIHDSVSRFYIQHPALIANLFSVGTVRSSFGNLAAFEADEIRFRFDDRYSANISTHFLSSHFWVSTLKVVESGNPDSFRTIGINPLISALSVAIFCWIGAVSFWNL